MSINRRHFLINTVATAAGAISAVGQNSAAKFAPESAANNLQNWRDVREQFNAVSLIHSFQINRKLISEITRKYHSSEIVRRAPNYLA
jgi:hypothetical protein